MLTRLILKSHFSQNSIKFKWIGKKKIKHTHTQACHMAFCFFFSAAFDSFRFNWTAIWIDGVTFKRQPNLRNPNMNKCFYILFIFSVLPHFQLTQKRHCCSMCNRQCAMWYETIYLKQSQHEKRLIMLRRTHKKPFGLAGFRAV